MKANLRARNEQAGNDEGVSPVIAVILMVAITVVLAATVYVWVSGFSSDEQGSENAQVRATGYDSDNNGASDWIRLTLVRGENAPYGIASLDLNVTDPDNEILPHNPNVAEEQILCGAIQSSDSTDPNTAGYDKDCNDGAGTPTGDAFGADTDDEWAAGQSLYVPCQAAGQHQLELSLRNSVVLDERIRCDEPAA